MEPESLADELFECVWPFCGVGAQRVNFSSSTIQPKNFIDGKFEQTALKKSSRINEDIREGFVVNHLLEEIKILRNLK